MKPNEQAAREYHAQIIYGQPQDPITDQQHINAHLAGQKFQIDTLAEMAREHEKAIDEAAEKCPATVNNVPMIVGFKAGANFGFTLGQASMQGEIDEAVRLMNYYAESDAEGRNLWRDSQSQLTKRDAEILRLNEMVEVMEKGLNKINKLARPETMEQQMNPSFTWPIYGTCEETLTKISELRKKL